MVVTTMLWSCKRSTDVVPSDTFKTNNDLTKSFPGADGVNDVLGYGLDVTGNLQDINSQSNVPIIDMARFVNDYPNGIDKNNTTAGTDVSFAGATVLEYLQDISTNQGYGISGSFGATTATSDNKNPVSFTGSVSKNTSDENKNGYSSRYSYATYESIQRIRRLQFTSDISQSLLMSYLTPQFQTDIANMGADDLIAKYRTHVLLGIDIGGILKFDYSGSDYNTTDYSKKTSDIKVGLGVSVLNIIGVNLNYNRNSSEITQITNSTADREYKVNFYGGSNAGTTISIDKDGNPSQAINLGAWQQSITPYNAALIGVVKAVYIYDFIADPNKKAQVKAAVEQYIQSKQPTIITQIAQGSGIPTYWASRSIFLSGVMPADAIHTSDQPILSSDGINTIYSQNRAYRFVLQGDGNLVLYNSANVGLWDSRTNRSSSGWTYRLYYALDGNIILRKVSSTGAEADIWASYTEAPVGTGGTENARRAYMWVQNDGNVALYYNGLNNGQYSLEYSTATDGGRKSSRPGSFK